MAEYVWPPRGSQAGTVIGPGSSTDNAVARFNGTTGDSIQNSGVLISDANAMTGIASAEVTGDVTVFNGTAKEFLLGKEAFEQSSTGCNSFSGFTNNTTTFDVGAGEGHIIDHAGLAYYDLAWTATTGHSPLTANGVTYVYIDSAGAVSLTTTAPTPVSRREKILLGRVATAGGNIATIQSMVQVSFDVSNSVADLSYAIRIFNVDGNILSANGANLRLNKSAGSLFSYGANFLTDDDNPHQVTTGSATAATFAYITQSAGSTGSNTQDVVPGSYDVVGTVTAIAGSSNQATIQRVYLFPSGNIRIAYGQTVYATLSAALQGVSSESFTINPSVPGNGVLIGLLVLTKGCTDLTNTTTARFLQVSRFGETSVGASGQSVSSLQNAYDNSTSPEITTDSTRGAVSIKRGSSADTDVVLEVLNGAGTAKFTVDGEGDTTAEGALTVNGASTTIRGTLLLQNTTGAQPELHLSEDPDNGTNKVVLKAPATLSADYTLTLPTDDGSASQVLQTDGSGVLSWVTVPASGSTILAADGSKTAPGFAFNSDTDTGIYRIGSGNVGFSANDTKIGEWSSVGAWTFGPTTGLVNHIVYGQLNVGGTSPITVASTTDRSIIGGKQSSVIVDSRTTAGMSLQLRAGVYTEFTGNFYATANLTGARLSVLSRSATSDSAFSFDTATSTSHSADATATVNSIGSATVAGAWTLGPSGFNDAHKINGLLGIDRTATSARLEVEGANVAGRFYSQSSTTTQEIFSLFSAVGGAGTQVWRVEADGDTISSTGSYTSDERAKKLIRTIPYGLTELMQLNPSGYRWKHEADTAVESFSAATAQVLEGVMPELVRDDGLDDGEGGRYKAIYTTELLAVVVKAIQELKAENDALKARIEVLENA